MAARGGHRDSQLEELTTTMRKTLVWATRQAKEERPVLCTKEAAKAFIGDTTMQRVARMLDGTRIAVLGEGRAVYMQYMTRAQLRNWL